ncbi:MAG: UvrD-helicase domain-containing protein [Acidobacteria bacterium]|nr:UvrD-helicase domain-containing protein [Acidobacteriota bacterium]
MTPGARTHGDDADRRLIRFGLDDTVIVEAAAGTGKTTELVQRVLNVLAQGRATIDQVVAVTFTEKAAGELKLRIRQELEQLRNGLREPAVLARITAAIQRLEEAHVSTIHGFCADLLRERPVEARVDPLFEVLTEARAARLFDEAFHVWLHGQLERPPEGVRRALRRSVWTRDSGADDGPIDSLRRAAWELSQWRDFDGPWRRDPFDRDAELAQVLSALGGVARMSEGAGSTRDPLYLDTRVVRELAHDVEVAGRLDLADPDRWEARVVDLAQNRDFRRARKGRGQAYGDGVDREAVWTALEALTAGLDGFQRAADADLAALLHAELAAVVEGYQRLKRAAGALDFVDLLLSARDLLVGHDEVRRTFQRRFTHLFVDEFQDTDPVQAEILLLLAAGDPHERDWRRAAPRPGKLFVVGDPKQAIYRFRRADVETYREVCERLDAGGAKRAVLTTSFRSTPVIQRAVNAAFAPLMDGDRETLQASYRPLMPSRDDAPDQPAVVALPVPAPYGTRRIAGYAIEDSLPGAVGAFVDWLVGRSGWTVTERTNRGELPIRVPVQPRHVCVLFRRFLQFGADVTRPYVEALEARGVPHLLVGGKSFHDREEVETLRAALAAVEWPEDELSVFATLRGALFALGDEALLEFRHRHKTLHPFRVPPGLEPPLREVGEALECLKELHLRRNRRPAADTLMELLAVTRAHVGFVLRPAGEQALANVLHVSELARQYELDGGLSFRGFVEELRRQSDGAQAAEAPILEEGSDGVRLMTVHKAKGLEFPVVVLADMTAKLRGTRADRLVDRGARACFLRLGRWTPAELSAAEPREIERDAAEGVRVAYVAATRARDLLVVPAVGDAPWEGGWTGPLNGAIYPIAGERRAAVPAPGCPPFRSDSVRRRPDDEPFTPQTVAPGLHRIGDGDAAFPLVWWDPHALDLDVGAPAGIRGEMLIAKDAPASVNAEGMAGYQRWKDAREATIAGGSTPSRSVAAATQWAALAMPVAAGATGGRAPPPQQRGLFEVDAPAADLAPEAEPDALPPVTLIDARGAERPGGLRFGELVHAVLAAAPLDAVRGDLDALAAVQGRILAATADEMAAAAATAERVLGHDLLARARAAAARGACRRESPIALMMADGSIVEGSVDLAFEEPEGWTIVDYKSDRELASEGEDRYRRQVAVYAAAVARVTGGNVRAMLIRI